MPKPARWLLCGWAAVLLFAAGAVAVPSASPAAAGLAASTLTTMFQRYGDTSGRWLGADRTASVPLPDGRVLWLFSDTFLGRPAPDGSRPQTSPLIHNSAIVQQGRRLTETITGGTPGRPDSLVPTGSGDEFAWIGDASVTGASVQVLVNRYRRTGAGPLEHALLGTSLAVLDLPALTLSGVRPLPLGDRVSWGSEVLTADGHTYVYGTEAAGQQKFAHLARVAGADLGGAWEFWNGAGWSAREAGSARLLSGVGTNYGVRRVGDRYVLVTHENNLMFSADFVAYTATSPSGPFDGPHYLFRAPETDDGHLVYDADLHLDQARPGKLLVSYNVNNVDDAVAYADATIYRPRFVDVDWPPDDGDDDRPDPPGGLTAAASGAGNASLAWQPADRDDLTYRVYRRDTSAGQTHFVRLPGDGPGAAHRYESDFLINGHTYEFGVTAVGEHGESRLSEVAAMRATVPPPPPPGDVRAEPGTAGDVAVRWAEVPFVQLFKIAYRDLTARADDRTVVGTFPGSSATIGPLRHGRTYEITVVAVGGGGESRPSAPVRVTPFVTPPGRPGAPAAEARPDGSVQLSWPPVGQNLSYRVHRRDLTAGQTRSSPPGLATGTRFRAEHLLHDHEYEFTIAAVNDGGAGPLSPPVRVRARVAAPTAAPAGLRAKPFPGRVKLTWRSAGSDWHWVFRRDLTAREREFTRDDIPVQGTEATVGNLVDGHEYEFTVAAFTPGGVGPQSRPVKVRLASVVPTGLKATATGPGTARLTWREIRPGLMYRIQLRDVTAGEDWRTDPYPVTGTVFDAALLTAGHRYEFRVLVPDGAASATAAVVAR